MTVTTAVGFRHALRSVRGDDRWCTPSLIGYDVADSRLDDVSVSYSRFRSPMEHSNYFCSLERLVAATRGASRAWLTTDGSTGGNRMALRAVAALDPNATVLLAQNTHHSVMNAAIIFGLTFVSFRRPWWQDLTPSCLPRPVKSRPH